MTLKRIIQAACQWYCDHFGTEMAFAISLLVFVVWVGLVPILGWTQWNSTVGLFGNTVESTGEWFFAVATLVLAGRITLHQSRERARTDALLKQIEEQSARIERMGEMLLDQLQRMER